MLGDDATQHVPLGEDPGELPALEDEDAADPAVVHQAGRFENRVRGGDGNDLAALPGEDIADDVHLPCTVCAGILIVRPGPAVRQGGPLPLTRE